MALETTQLARPRNQTVGFLSQDFNQAVMVTTCGYIVARHQEIDGAIEIAMLSALERQRPIGGVRT
jgi:hypothetical protein